MGDFYKDLKRDLEESSNEHATITVSRKNLEMLVKSYENLLDKINNNYNQKRTEWNCLK